jgi:hypothetical protein
VISISTPRPSALSNVTLASEEAGIAAQQSPKTHKMELIGETSIRVIELPISLSMIVSRPEQTPACERLFVGAAKRAF